MSRLGGKVFSEDTDKDSAGGQVDSVVGGTNCAVDATDPVNPIVNADDQIPLTTKGDLLSFSTVDGRLPVGTDGFHLVAASGETFGLKWEEVSSASPLTTKGDVFTYDTGDQRLAVGTNGQVLSADSAEATGLKWIAAAAGGGTLTTKGDLESYTTSQVRLPVGANDQVLTADSAAAAGVAWKAPAAAPVFSGAFVHNTGTQTVNATLSTLTWDAEDYDTDNWHDNVTNPERFTVPAGVAYIRLHAMCQDTTSVSGQLNLKYFKNGSDDFVGSCTSEHETAGGDAIEMTSGVIPVVATDYFEVHAFATNSRTTNAGNFTNFSIEKVG